ncbi:TetR/AcrR family transcriptional regulator [Glaciecola siphonariae]|uniref:TetR/AcrR family transcriptional regulator n=1 Tax=Glaciecola siphonariae TaxID=521012 RepID=A0ABV9LT16_9ALTE
MQSSKGNNAREKAKLLTQQAIKDAASDQFFSIGFAGTSLSDIAKAAGVKVPLIVYHFKSKELLWRECVDDVFNALNTAVSLMLSEISGLQGKAYLRALLTGYINATASAPEYLRLTFLEGMQASSRLTWLVDTHQRKQSELILHIIEQAQAAGTLKKVDKMHAKYILAAAVGAPFILGPEFELITGKSAKTDEVIEQHVETCIALLFDLSDEQA